eukprot:2752833-Amphidinium_carterae.1
MQESEADVARYRTAHPKRAGRRNPLCPRLKGSRHVMPSSRKFGNTTPTLSCSLTSAGYARTMRSVKAQLSASARCESVGTLSQCGVEAAVVGNYRLEVWDAGKFHDMLIWISGQPEGKLTEKAFVQGCMELQGRAHHTPRVTMDQTNTGEKTTQTMGIRSTLKHRPMSELRVLSLFVFLPILLNTGLQQRLSACCVTMAPETK